jgi:hypothetical protein
MRVELDVFSGLPNPQWEMPPDRADQLPRELAALPPTARAPSPPDLGYRGVHLFDGAGREIGTIFAGVATFGGGRHLDPGRRLERRILETGRGRVDEALLTDVLAEISGHPGPG